MIERRLVHSLSSFALLILLGCSGEKPTSHVVAKLPATPLSSQIVSDSSAAVVGTTTSDRIYEFDFSGLPQYAARSYSDIAFYLLLGLDQLPEHIEVLDHANQEWREVDGAAVASGAYACFDYCLAGVNRLVSEAGTVDQMISGNGKFVAKAALRQSYTHSSARLVKFTSDYHAVGVMPTPTCRYEYLAFQDGTLYLTSDHASGLYRDIAIDSVVALDVSGERLWSTGFDTRDAYQSIYDGRGFWQHKDIDDTFLVRVDSSGQETAQIEWPLGYFRSMVWANGSLWCVHSELTTEGFPIIEVDVDSSLAVGTAVYSTRFTIPQMHVDAMTADADGLILISGNRILRYTYDGTLRSQQLAPFPIRAAAWDGESLWVLHHGPNIAHTDATLLSRFELD